MRPHEPTEITRKQVEALAGYGIPEADISRVIGISENTLRKHYAGELSSGHVRANAAVAQNLFKIATGTGREAVTASIFWLKVRAGWSEYAQAGAPPGAGTGKKAQADADALTAAADTGWAEFVH